MNYKLKFLPTALKEWNKLDGTLKSQLKKKLAQRLVTPHVPSAKLTEFENHYKIKLRSSGYRLVYEVMDDEFLVVVIAIGKRENNSVYKKARKR